MAVTAGGLLKASSGGNGQMAARPTLLPLPGELPPQEPAVVRINRLAFRHVVALHATNPVRR